MSKKQPIFYKQNRLKQLRAFCHAAQTGSISRAASRIFLSQPTVSVQIQSLEKELGVKLFNRVGPKITLSDEGRVLLRIALPLIEKFDSFPQTFDAELGVIKGSLTIAAGESVILYLIPEIIKEYQQRFVNVNLNLKHVGVSQFFSTIEQGDADIAIGSLMSIPKHVNYLPFFNTNPILIAPLDSPISQEKEIHLEKISNELILSTQNLTNNSLIDLMMKQNNIDYKVKLWVDSWEIVKKYVEIGMGLSIVNDLCIKPEDKLYVRSLYPMFPKRSYGVVHLKEKNITPQAQAFMDICKEKFQMKI